MNGVLPWLGHPLVIDVLGTVSEEITEKGKSILV